MPTTVVKSIGTSSRDYSTLQAWEDAAPSDLTLTRSNTATGGSTSTIVFDAGASGTDGIYVGLTVTNASSEERLITAYVGATKTATVGILNGSSATWTAPTNGSAYTINSVVWQGQCYNDSEFLFNDTTGITINGETTSASCYLELTTALGQSFQDNANVRDNALRYSQANGVCIRVNGTGYTSYGIVNHVSFTKISKLQLKVGGGGNFGCLASADLADSVQVRDLIVEMGATTGRIAVNIGVNSIGVNITVFVISGDSTVGAFQLYRQSAKLINCTAVRTSDQPVGGVAVHSTYGYYILEVLTNFCSFGFATVVDQTFSSSCSNNATDQASGFAGSANVYNVAFNATTPFVNAAVSGYDLRSTLNSRLVGSATLDSVNALRDISGCPRPSIPTIGAWEPTKPNILGNFNYCRSLTIDHTQCGSTDSSNFPVLVYISDATLKDAAHSGNVQSSLGGDILFFSDRSATTQLPSEIESYDNVNGVLWAWVQVPTVSHTANVVFYAFYGTVNPPLRMAGTWDNNFLIVYHMGDAQQSKTIMDSSIHGNNATNQVNTAIQTTTGEISKGINFSASSDYATSANITIGQTVTIEGWVNLSAVQDFGRFITFGPDNSHFGYTLQADNSSPRKMEFFVQPVNGGQNQSSGTVTTSAGWQQFAGTYDGATTRLFVNGIQQGIGASTTQAGSNTAAIVLATYPGSLGSSGLQGAYDEIRISNVVRSPDWILTSYNNQVNPASFVTVGSQSGLTVVPGQIEVELH